MTGTPEYSWEKFYLAVMALASGRGELRARLSDAYWHNLHSLTGSPLPWEDLQERFKQLQEKLVPEMSSHGTMNSGLGEDDLRGVAKEIVSIFDTVSARYRRD